MSQWINISSGGRAERSGWWSVMRLLPYYTYCSKRLTDRVTGVTVLAKYISGRV